MSKLSKNTKKLNLSRKQLKLMKSANASVGKNIKRLQFIIRGRHAVKSQHSLNNMPDINSGLGSASGNITTDIEKTELSFSCLVSKFRYKERFMQKHNNNVLDEQSKSYENVNDYLVSNLSNDNINFAKEAYEFENKDSYIGKHVQNNGAILDVNKDRNDDTKDMLCKHFHYDLTPELVEQLVSKSINMETSTLIWPTLGKLHVTIPKSFINIKSKTHKAIHLQHLRYAAEGLKPFCKLLDLKNASVVPKLFESITMGRTYLTNKNGNFLTCLQTELFCILNNYQDLFYPQETLESSEEIRFIYCFHVLNHVLKTQLRINHNNRKIAASNKKNQKDSILISINDSDFRDRGLVRPKVLILLPYRHLALQVINVMVDFLFLENSESCKTNGTITNYNRFLEEFGGDEGLYPKKAQKPVYYENVFLENTCDNFKLGVCLSTNSVKLYTEFYSSDVIIASPLAIRRLIGAPGDIERDFDFLNSIELLVFDEADIFLAQNWDNILHILDHMHLKPMTHRTTDFSRVRSWCLNELSQFYRQTVLFSHHELPELRSFFENRCLNYSGKVHISNPISIGSIQNIFVNIPQIFYKIDTSSFQNSFDSRFKYFIQEILPKFRKPCISHCMVYIPSYYDFIRVRNYFKQESINFVQICEYTKIQKKVRARDIFYHSGSKFLLYSERSHFFQRTQIKGIRHLIIYQSPTWPNFYAEIINLMHESNQNVHDGLGSFMSITVLYTKYDMLQMNGILGSKDALKLLKSKNVTHIFSCSK